MQSCFFFSRPFHENFKFLKNCPYDFYKILHSHSTPKGAPACAMASKSYDWVVRNIAKTSPKMAEKQPFFDFFRFSQKLSIRFERNFLQLFYTIIESYMCNGIKIVWLGCEKHSQSSPKMAKKQPFFHFFRFSQKLSIRFERNFLQLFYTILESYMCNDIKIVWLGCEKHSPKMAKKPPFFDFFRFSQKLSIRFERNFLVILHHIRVLYVQWHQNRMAGM